MCHLILLARTILKEEAYIIIVFPAQPGRERRRVQSSEITPKQALAPESWVALGAGCCRAAASDFGVRGAEHTSKAVMGEEPVPGSGSVHL